MIEYKSKKQRREEKDAARLNELVGRTAAVIGRGFEAFGVSPDVERDRQFAEKITQEMWNIKRHDPDTGKSHGD